MMICMLCFFSIYSDAMINFLPVSFQINFSIINNRLNLTSVFICSELCLFSICSVLFLWFPFSSKKATCMHACMHAWPWFGSTSTIGLSVLRVIVSSQLKWTWLWACLPACLPACLRMTHDWHQQICVLEQKIPQWWGVCIAMLLFSHWSWQQRIFFSYGPIPLIDMTSKEKEAWQYSSSPQDEI